MVESYLQTRGPKRPPASARLGILLGLALVAFIVLGLILRSLGAGAILLGLVLFALGLALGWNARGRREPAQKVAALPVRPTAPESTTEDASPARAYALQVLELNTPANTQERPVPEIVEDSVVSVAREKHIEISAELVARAPEPTLEISEPRAETTERKKWNPRASVPTPSSTLESTIALEALETTPLETETPVVLEPVTLEPTNLERKKWTPKSSKSGVLDTLSRSQSLSLEPEPSSEPPLYGPVTLEASAYSEMDLPDVQLLDVNVSQSGAPARRKWIPKVKRESAAPGQAVVLALAETQTALEPVDAHTALEPVNAHIALEPISSAKLDSRQILENMGIYLPVTTLNPSISISQVDLNPPDSSEPEAAQVSSERKKWVPRRKA